MVNFSTFPGIILCVVLALLWPFGVSANPQVWTLVDGAGFEAEFVGVFGTEVTFKNAGDELKKVPLERLSEESRTRVELKNPPKLSFDLIKDRDTKNFPVGMSLSTQRPPEDRCYFGIRIKQTSANAYNHELSFELFVMGSERLGNKFILLDHLNGRFFLNRENRRVVEFRSDREVALRNFMWGQDKRGEKYYGYLAVVKDARGEIIAVRTTHDWLFESYTNLRERYVGNFIDKTGVRVFPTRPPFRK